MSDDAKPGNGSAPSSTPSTAAVPDAARPDHASPYPVSRLAPAFDLVDAAKEIQRADDMLGVAVGHELMLIAEQMRALRAKAQEVLERARRDAELHRARCEFQRRPGHIYHLYRRANDELYFSMLSPADWGDKPPHEHRGSFRLEADMSWTPVEDAADRDRERAELRRLLES